MARRIIEGLTEFTTFSKREVVDLIAKLTAQLGDVAVERHSLGACPEFSLILDGGVQKRAVFSIEPKVKAWHWPLLPGNHLFDDPIDTFEAAQFGSVRKFDVHTGIDLHCVKHSPVFAVERGEVLCTGLFTGPRANSPWWEETYYIAIQGASGIVVYGELAEPIIPIGRIERGDFVGNVRTVLTKDKGLPTTMLHLELYDVMTPLSEIPMTWSLGEKRSQWLLDPTLLLRESWNVYQSLRK